MSSANRPPEESPAAAGREAAPTKGRTMPPPELLERAAPASVSELVLQAARSEAPVPRHGGPRAEEGSLRARLVESQASGDAAGEREAAIALARLLAARGTDLDAATKLARRALSLGDDLALRVELAGWLAGLGEAGIAAATLRTLCSAEGADAASAGSETARTLVKIAVLLARAGDAQGAADALIEASAHDPSDAMAGELLGTLAAWAPELVPPAAAAAAYLEAATRREAHGDAEAAFEDRLRAFELAPADEHAARALAEMLTNDGRGGAADEVLRGHAAALGMTLADGGQAELSVHRTRMLMALKAGDSARAVSALLDAHFEVDIDGDLASKIDEALSGAGLYELFALRLELRGERARTPAARAEAFVALARLFAGPLGSPERAAEAWIHVLANDPGSEAALAALREHGAQTGDNAALVEALVRAGEAGAGSAASRVAAMRTLVGIADGPFDAPTLAIWALEKIGAAGGVTDMLNAEVQRHKPRVEREDAGLAAARAALLASDEAGGAAVDAGPASRMGTPRIDALRTVASTYLRRPDARGEAVRALAELLRACPTDASALLAVERIAGREGRSGARDPAAAGDAGNELGARPQARAALEAHHRARIDAAALHPADADEARLSLAVLRRRSGDVGGALDAIAPLLEDPGGGPGRLQRGAASLALLLATFANRPEARAAALEGLARPVWPGLRAALLAVAADLYAQVGAIERARTAATLACEADPKPLDDTGGSSRPAPAGVARARSALASIAMAASGRHAPGSVRGGAADGPNPTEAIDRLGAAAIERAMAAVVPRGELCDALATTLDELGEAQLAFAWTQRWLALRPGAPRAMAELLRRATALGDAPRVSDAVSWVLAQPEPLAALVTPIADALDALLILDRTKARALARKALDVVGPRVPELRERLVAFSERARDAGLAIAVLERHLASEAVPAAEAHLLFELAARRGKAGDFDGAARELARAAERGADATTVLSRTDALESAAREAASWLDSDGLLGLSQARAQALTALGPAATASAAQAWRELGSLRWDLAGDRIGGEEAFYRASELLPKGVACFARDLVDFGGVDDAIAALFRRAERAGIEGEPRTRAELLIEAAALAHAAGHAEDALRAGYLAIASDPTRADVLPFVERNAHVDGGVEALDEVYDRVAGAALGIFGRRAAHSRGSRQLERRGSVDLALKHAALALEALPTEGIALTSLTRLAERASDPGDAVRALVRVAEASTKGARPGWLRKAAELAGDGEEAARTRVDLLLRALKASPDAPTVALIAAALEALRARDPDVADTTMRLDRAFRESLARLDGPEGARTAIAIADLCASFGSVELAFAALTRAAGADGDVDEFGTLTPRVHVLASNGEARAWVAAIRAAAEKPYSSVGGALLRLASLVARAIGEAATAEEDRAADGKMAAALLVHAARRSPDDDELLNDAAGLVLELGDAELRATFNAAVPAARRVAAAVAVADRHERAGDIDAAVRALEAAAATAGIATPTRVAIGKRLRELSRLHGRVADLERLVHAELDRSDVEPRARVRLARELADLARTSGNDEEALAALTACARAGADDVELLTDLRILSRRVGDVAGLAATLGSLADSASTDATRLRLLRELAPIHTELEQRAAALQCYEAIARIEPDDADALEHLEHDAEERGDHNRIAELLGRRIPSAPLVRRRMLRLRRAAVLEQRLGRLEEASAELRALVAEDPDDVGALRYLADLADRLGRPADAAPLLQRLGELASKSDERAEYGLRACTMYVAAGDLANAREALDAVAPIAERDSVIELRVELARRDGDGAALSEWLEQLAASSRDSAERRAQILVDAARAASAIGDEMLALDRARRATRLHPASVDAVLEARRLEYKLGGSGTPREAQAFVDELLKLEDQLTVKPDEPAKKGAAASGSSPIELHAFLLAEELDVIQGGGAGMRELTRRHAEVGPLPLIAIGMAERLVRAKNFESALPLFERAVAGDLRGLRSRGRVALAAAACAVSAGSLEVAARMLDLAVLDPDTRVAAERRRLELTALGPDPVAARRALEELVRHTAGTDKARALLKLGSLLALTDPGAAAQALAEAEPLAAGEKALHQQVVAEIARVIDPTAPRMQSDSEPEIVSDEEIEPIANVDASAAAPPSSAPMSTPPRVDPPVAPAATPPEEMAAEELTDDDAIELEAIDDEPPPSRSRAAPAPLAPEAALARLGEDAPASVRARADESFFRPVPHTRTPSNDLPEPAAAPVAAPVLESGPPAPTNVQNPPLRSASPAPPAGAERNEVGPTLVDAEPMSSAEHVSSPPSVVMRAVDPGEQNLLRELMMGSIESGERLLALYAASPRERVHDILAILRQMVLRAPGDRALVERLLDAAVRDHNTTYAAAISHTLAVFTHGEKPAPPPPLAAQREAPELLHALLFRPIVESGAHQALAIVWETGLFRRDLSAYGLTGVERVQPGAGTTIGDTYAHVARLFGQLRTALFHRRAPSSALEGRIALLAPPAVLLGGDARDDSPELRYALGATIAGALPEHALVNGLPEDELRVVLDALLAAFGPLGAVPRDHAKAVRLAQDLWQMVPRRHERRLRTICERPDALAAGEVVGKTRQAMRRAGLFAAGDLGTALRMAVAELSSPLDASRPWADLGMAAVCGSHPGIADLVGLALRSEYAEARFSAAGVDRRRTESGAKARPSS